MPHRPGTGTHGKRAHGGSWPSSSSSGVPAAAASSDPAAKVASAGGEGRIRGPAPKSSRGCKLSFEPVGQNSPPACPHALNHRPLARRQGAARQQLAITYAYLITRISLGSVFVTAVAGAPLQVTRSLTCGHPKLGTAPAEPRSSHITTTCSYRRRSLCSREPSARCVAANRGVLHAARPGRRLCDCSEVWCRPTGLTAFEKQFEALEELEGIARPLFVAPKRTPC